jgi:hypothetical protein
MKLLDGGPVLRHDACRIASAHPHALRLKSCIQPTCSSMTCDPNYSSAMPSSDATAGVPAHLRHVSARRISGRSVSRERAKVSSIGVSQIESPCGLILIPTMESWVAC